MAKIKIMTTLNAGEDAEKLGHRHIASRNVKCYRHFEKQLGRFLKNEAATITLPSNCTPGHLS